MAIVLFSSAFSFSLLQFAKDSGTSVQTLVKD